MSTSRQIIQRLGGVRYVAQELNEQWKTVHNWTRPGRRIPARFWHPLSEMFPPRHKRAVAITELLQHEAVLLASEARFAGTLP